MYPHEYVCVRGAGGWWWVKLELVQKHRVILHMPRYSIHKYGNRIQSFTHERQLSHHKPREPIMPLHVGKLGLSSTPYKCSR